MKLQELISQVSTQTNIPAGQVRLVATAMMQTLAAAIEAGEPFQSPILRIQPRPNEELAKLGRHAGRIVVVKKSQESAEA